MLRETSLALGLLACVAACTTPTTTTSTSEPTRSPPGSGRGAPSVDPPSPPAANSPGARHAPPAVDAETLAGRRYWADPQRAGWTYEVDLCPGQRAVERNSGKNVEGKYELHGTELVITFADRVARFQFPSGPAFMLGTNKLGRPQKLEHKGDSDCSQ